MRRRAAVFLCLAAAILLAASAAAGVEGWRRVEGTWQSRDGGPSAGEGIGVLLRDGAPPADAAVSADVTNESELPFAAAGLLVRYDPQARTGYAACVREIERGVDPQTGPWERPLLRLFRLDLELAYARL